MIGGGLDPWRIVLAILVVAGMLALIPLLLRRFRTVAAVPSGQTGPEVVAQRSLDMRHRLVVVRYRQMEHLIVLGGTLPVALGQQIVAETAGSAETRA